MSRIDEKALFRLESGLYVLTVRDGERDNGCVVNTVTQVTASPLKVAVTVHKQNLTAEWIQKTGRVNVNSLSTDAPFDLIRRFGYAGGRDTDKFADFPVLRSENGLAVLPHYANAYLSLEVEQTVDVGTHQLFICTVSEAAVLSKADTMTYSYYQKQVKPSAPPASDTPTPKHGFVCKICGYVYEGDTLPADFVCPLCKHGAADFEPL